MRQIIFALAQMEITQNSAGFLEAFGLTDAFVGKRQGNIINHRQARDEIEMLKNKADIARTNRGVVCRRQILD